MLPQVLILDEQINVYKKCANLLKLKEFKTFKRDKLFINNVTLTFQNEDDFFSVNKNSSIFKNIVWRYQSFKVINSDGETIWDGIIQDMKRNHDNKTVQITTVDKLYKLRSEKIAYTSSDWETPSNAVKNIMDAVSFTDYNLKSITDSSNKYNDYDGNDSQFLIKCFFELDDNITLQQALEKLSDVGCADCFSSKNKVYFKHWKAFTGGAKVTLTINSIDNSPIVWTSETDAVNDYRINYNGSAEVPVTDGTGNDIASVSRTRYGIKDLNEMNCSENSQIVIQNLAGATYIGECYINRSHIDLSTNPRFPDYITFTLPGSHKEWIDLETYFKLTFADEDWVEKLFEVYSFEIDYDKDEIKILALEI